MVTFKERTHQYFNDNGEEYYSVTKFLHCFEAPFDKYGISLNVARKEGVTQEEILKRWKEKSIAACEYGTAIHAKMEDYIKTGRREEGYEGLYQSFDDALGRDIKYAKAVHSEHILWNDQAKIAGTADLIVDLQDNEFLVADFKTNGKFDFFSAYGNRMKDPVAHLSSCNYTIYSLQLSVYAYFHSLLTGRKCRNLLILYKEGERWTKIPVCNMQHEVMVLFDYYRKHPELLAPKVYGYQS